MGAFATLVDNIKAGTRLALMLPVEGDEFRPSADQAVLLLAIGVALDVAHDFVMTEPGRNFNLWGLSTRSMMSGRFSTSPMLDDTVMKKIIGWGSMSITLRPARLANSSLGWLRKQASTSPSITMSVRLFLTPSIADPGPAPSRASRTISTSSRSTSRPLCLR